MVSTYNLLCPVVFGAGSLEKLGEKIQEFKGKKVFCIYDQGVKMAGIAKKVTNVLEKNNIPFDVFEDVIKENEDYKGRTLKNLMFFKCGYPQSKK